MSLGTQEEQTEGMKRQARDLIDQAYQRGFKAGVEYQKENYQDTQTELIEQGRNEAWEAAKKIYLKFPHKNVVAIFTTYSASEAIEKLKEQKKQEEDAEIRVGDEVILNDALNYGDKAVVTGDLPDGFCIMKHDGSTSFKYKENIGKKTGRTFPEIAEVLNKMQEGK